MNEEQVKFINQRIQDAIDNQLLFEVIDQIIKISRAHPNEKQIDVIVDSACDEWDI